ncbi:hypothetical protein BCR44DRAFT_1442917 [Catenaria anguillulae PL171]|uniref:Uncharacterized protein n=1 Tax=Catenaria anguillulae PL171 TaxID=765915 RepID=A0A1Y2HB78_9FUNG|nr:hypothetical protein BCR44DRAFT_1442917 [Catenaria anguillulae PL171]
MQSVYLLPLTFGHQPSPHITLLPALPNLTSSAMQDLLNGWTRVRFLAQAAVHHLPMESRALALSAVGTALIDALRFTDHLRLTFPSTPTVSELRESSTSTQGMLQWFHAAEQAVRDVDPAHVPPSHPFFAATVGIVTQAQQAANQVWVPLDKSQVVDAGRVVRAALIALVRINVAGSPAPASGERSLSVGMRTGGAGGARSLVVERAVFPGLMDLATGRVLCPCVCTVESSVS